MANDRSKWFETLALSAVNDHADDNGLCSSISLTSAFSFPDENTMKDSFSGKTDALIYSRLSNPNTNDLARRMAMLEGGEAAACFASGMAAISCTLFALLKQGDHMVSSSAIFGTTRHFFNEHLRRFGIKVSYADPEDPDTWRKLVTSSTKVFYTESPSNPSLIIADIESLSAIARAHSIKLIVDNTFATPYLQQPLSLGADISLHSATKFIDGQGRVLGGIAIGSKADMQIVESFNRITGAVMSPFTAWILFKGLETLAVRLDRQAENALVLSEFLATHPAVKSVNYPWHQNLTARKQMRNGGSMLCFDLREKDEMFTSRLKVIRIAATLGDVHSLISHPASTTHSGLTGEELVQSRISASTYRLSAGLENIDDLILDLDQALK